MIFESDYESLREDRLVSFLEKQKTGTCFVPKYKTNSYNLGMFSIQNGYLIEDKISSKKMIGIIKDINYVYFPFV